MYGGIGRVAREEMAGSRMNFRKEGIREGEKREGDGRVQIKRNQRWNLEKKILIKLAKRG